MSVRRPVLGRYQGEISRASGSYGWILDLPRQPLKDSALWYEMDSRNIASILGGRIEMFAIGKSLLGRCSGPDYSDRARVGYRRCSSNVGFGCCLTWER